MQVLPINPYNKYFSSRVQRTEAKNPNFGLKIVYDEADVASVVGKDKAGIIKKAIEGMNQNMSTWFKTVFRKNPKLKLMHKETHVQEFLDKSGDIVPFNLIEDWETLELKTTFINEGDKIGLEIFDGKLRVFGDSKEKDTVVGAVTALHRGLENYVAEKMAKELVDASFPIQKTPEVVMIIPPEALRPPKPQSRK